MTDEVKEEIQEEVTEIVEEEQQDDAEETSEEETPSEDIAEQQEESEEEKQKRIAREEFLERNRQKARQATENIPARQEQAQDDDELAELKQAAQELKFQKLLSADKQALTKMETEFKSHVTDYDDVVNSALEATKLRMMSSGMDEATATHQLEIEKIKLANQAVAQGKDPVEAVYNEAKGINDWIDQLAESRGYKRQEVNKTKMQAMREAAKPNAMTAGVGRGATATSKTFDDLDNIEDIQNVTLADMLKGA